MSIVDLDLGFLLFILLKNYIIYLFNNLWIFYYILHILYCILSSNESTILISCTNIEINFFFIHLLYMYNIRITNFSYFMRNFFPCYRLNLKSQPWIAAFSCWRRTSRDPRSVLPLPLPNWRRHRRLPMRANGKYPLSYKNIASIFVQMVILYIIYNEQLLINEK